MKVESPSDSSTGSSKPQGGDRARETPEEAAQQHLPGSERWTQWARQLQMLGLTQEQADAALLPFPALLKRAPANTDEKLKRLAAAILRDDLTPEQLKQIAMSCPNLLRMASTRSISGNLNWFKGTLGVTTEAWVQMVCKCQPLLTVNQLSLQVSHNWHGVVAYDLQGLMQHPVGVMIGCDENCNGLYGEVCWTTRVPLQG